MSNLEKELREVAIRKAKYRVKNSEGKYEVVYLETSADQVEETSDRVFVTPAEKSQITSNQEAITAEAQAREEAVNGLSGRLDVVEGNGEGSINKALQDAKAYTDNKISEVNSSNEALNGKVETLEEQVALVDGKISTAKDEAVESAKTYTDSEISKIDTAYKAADAQTLESAKSYADTKVQEAKIALEGSIADVDGKVDTAKTELQGNIDALAGRVSVNESEISDIKDILSNKNSNTVVVNTEDEIATANPNPKVGDMAYVVSTKRAYIFKGVEEARTIAGQFLAGDAVVVADEPAMKALEQGWIVFDEITSELDLVDYLKKSDAEATYRKLADKIAEGDLATELATKINNKADKSYVDEQLAGKTNEAYVDSKVEEVVAPVRTKAEANEAAISEEVAKRQSEISRVEGLVSDVNDSLTEKEAALKAEDAKLNNRISKLVPVVASEEPVDTEAGHVWLEIQA